MHPQSINNTSASVSQQANNNQTPAALTLRPQPISMRSDAAHLAQTGAAMRGVDEESTLQRQQHPVSTPGNVRVDDIYLGEMEDDDIDGSYLQLQSSVAKTHSQNWRRSSHSKFRKQSKNQSGYHTAQHQHNQHQHSSVGGATPSHQAHLHHLSTNNHPAGLRVGAPISNSEMAATALPMPPQSSSGGAGPGGIMSSPTISRYSVAAAVMPPQHGYPTPSAHHHTPAMLMASHTPASFQGGRVPATSSFLGGFPSVGVPDSYAGTPLHNAIVGGQPMTFSGHHHHFMQHHGAHLHQGPLLNGGLSGPYSSHNVHPHHFQHTQGSHAQLGPTPPPGATPTMAELQLYEGTVEHVGRDILNMSNSLQHSPTPMTSYHHKLVSSHTPLTTRMDSPFYQTKFAPSRGPGGVLPAGSQPQVKEGGIQGGSYPKYESIKMGASDLPPHMEVSQSMRTPIKGGGGYKSTSSRLDDKLPPPPVADQSLINEPDSAGLRNPSTTAPPHQNDNLLLLSESQEQVQQHQPTLTAQDSFMAPAPEDRNDAKEEESLLERSSDVVRKGNRQERQGRYKDSQVQRSKHTDLVQKQEPSGDKTDTFKQDQQARMRQPIDSAPPQTQADAAAVPSRNQTQSDFDSDQDGDIDDHHQMMRQYRAHPTAALTIENTPVSKHHKRSDQRPDQLQDEDKKHRLGGRIRPSSKLEQIEGLQTESLVRSNSKPTTASHMMGRFQGQRLPSLKPAQSFGAPTNSSGERLVSDGKQTASFFRSGQLLRNYQSARSRGSAVGSLDHEAQVGSMSSHQNTTSIQKQKMQQKGGGPMGNDAKIEETKDEQQPRSSGRRGQRLGDIDSVREQSRIGGLHESRAQTMSAAAENKGSVRQGPTTDHEQRQSKKKGQIQGDSNQARSNQSVLLFHSADMNKEQLSQSKSKEPMKQRKSDFSIKQLERESVGDGQQEKREITTQSNQKVPASQQPRTVQNNQHEVQEHQQMMSVTQSRSKSTRQQQAAQVKAQRKDDLNRQSHHSRGERDKNQMVGKPASKRQLRRPQHRQSSSSQSPSPSPEQSDREQRYKCSGRRPDNRQAQDTSDDLASEEYSDNDSSSEQQKIYVSGAPFMPYGSHPQQFPLQPPLHFGYYQHPAGMMPPHQAFPGPPTAHIAGPHFAGPHHHQALVHQQAMSGPQGHPHHHHMPGHHPSHLFGPDGPPPQSQLSLAQQNHHSQVMPGVMTPHFYHSSHGSMTPLGHPHLMPHLQRQYRGGQAGGQVGRKTSQQQQVRAQHLTKSERTLRERDLPESRQVVVATNSLRPSQLRREEKSLLHPQATIKTKTDARKPAKEESEDEDLDDSERQNTLQSYTQADLQSQQQYGRVHDHGSSSAFQQTPHHPAMQLAYHGNGTVAQRAAQQFYPGGYHPAAAAAHAHHHQMPGQGFYSGHPVMLGGPYPHGHLPHYPRYPPQMANHPQKDPACPDPYCQSCLQASGHHPEQDDGDNQSQSMSDQSGTESQGDNEGFGLSLDGGDHHLRGNRDVKRKLNLTNRSPPQDGEQRRRDKKSGGAQVRRSDQQRLMPQAQRSHSRRQRRERPLQSTSRPDS